MSCPIIGSGGLLDCNQQALKVPWVYNPFCSQKTMKLKLKEANKGLRQTHKFLLKPLCGSITAMAMSKVRGNIRMKSVCPRE